MLNPQASKLNMEAWSNAFFGSGGVTKESVEELVSLLESDLSDVLEVDYQSIKDLRVLDIFVYETDSLFEDIRSFNEVPLMWRYMFQNRMRQVKVKLCEHKGKLMDCRSRLITLPPTSLGAVSYTHLTLPTILLV